MSEENKLPKHWKVKKLGELCGIVYGKGLPVKQLKPTGFPVFGANGIIGFNDKYMYEEPQVLISCRGAYSGKINFSPAKCYITNNSLILDIRKKEELDKNYLFYALSISNKTKLVTGTAQPQVTINNAVDLEIPIPPKIEQKVIVAKIEELLSDLENGKQQLQIARLQLKVYRQSLLKWAFEGRFGFTQRAGNSIKDGELPQGWKWMKLSEVANKITDGEHITPRRTSEGILLLSARNIRNGTLALKDVDHIPIDEYARIIKRCNPEHGDILISCSGSIGRVCRVPLNLKFTLVRSVALVKFDWEKYSSKFYEYLFQSPLLQKQIDESKKATAQANIFLGPIKNLDVIVCPLNEQQCIVDELESKLTVCDKIEETIIQSLQQAETLRQSILKKAFEGKLV